MDPIDGEPQHLFADETELSLLQNSYLPSIFFPSANLNGEHVNFGDPNTFSEPERMHVDTELAHSKWTNAAECHQDHPQNHVRDRAEDQIASDGRKRRSTYNDDSAQLEESEYTWNFEPSPKKHKGDVEFYGITSSQCLLDGSQLQSSAIMSPESFNPADSTLTSNVAGDKWYQQAHAHGLAYTADLQDMSEKMLSFADLNFDHHDPLELEAAETSMKFESDKSSSFTGEQSPAEEARLTLPVSGQPSESSFTKPHPTSCDGGTQTGGKVLPDDYTLQQCDTCFGMEELVCLYHRTSGEFVGVADGITGRALGQLNGQFMTAYHSFILLQDGSKSVKTASARRYKLQTLIYGLGKDADAVGALLSAHDLFLQHPRKTDPTKLYSNPHYLSRPGGNMDIPQYGTTAAIDTYPDRSVLDEVGHARILRIFDSAQGPPTFVKPQIVSDLKTQLKDHQISALAMMFEKENGVVEDANFPSLWQIRKFSGNKRYFNVITGAYEAEGSELSQGGLIADDMGLGKTLTALAFVASSNAANKDSGNHSGEGSRRRLTSLVVAPKTAIPVWEEQIQKHFEDGTLRLHVYHGMARKSSDFASLDYDIVITTYETLSTEWSRHPEKPLFSHIWHRIILDEAHMIRNSTSAKHRAVCDLRARYRWCLTGTPIQNRIEDYGAILKFLRIPPFLSKHSFNHYIANPIQSGRDEGFRTLKTLVEATSLRRTKKSELKQNDLPKRQVIVQPVDLSTTERGIYDFFKEKAANIVSDLHGEARRNNPLGTILPTLTRLRQICNHSTGLLPPAILAAAEGCDQGSPYDSGLQQDRCDNCHLVLAETEEMSLTALDLPCSHLLCQKCLCMAQNDENEGATDGSLLCLVCSAVRSSPNQASPRTPATHHRALEAGLAPSTKMLALLENLRQDRSASAEPPFKSVVFSCWTRTLDLIELVLNQDGFKFQRIDGSKSLSQQRDALKTFSEDPKCLVMLASIDCAGCGLDLTAANRVHLMEPQWNPMKEEQALDRVYRLGQQREVLAIRYIVKDSIEEVG
ncbi:uncharacterized protein Z518_02020 [Rhinocladiella mackenziei CBS 650.93]|uniref:Rhinocladiella mackenziei CBS 650.93 unplaced genomic scaffold supercont1.2, whole genome shotgun sequence n=1 Tax=Rhinocladiella mackenziei CBS 650.93 TaxID=1442369 RepID=A0A0D2FYH4_9EURO|nr:uncharacterized protein Z518_02020 [Rhinocladiella mackenziei CBS 650.93]KIX07367.1 hypothetical protein Z518_02020 [Rhinocladiella mackenziei CBS 650.93]